MKVLIIGLSKILIKYNPLSIITNYVFATGEAKKEEYDLSEFDNETILYLCEIIGNIPITEFEQQILNKRDILMYFKRKNEQRDFECSDPMRIIYYK